MRVIVTGATGNVGTSVIEALLERPEVSEVIGLARRRPAWEPAKTRWVSADVLSSELEPLFGGADAVIHLAWAVQPSRDPEALKRINVGGSRRVFDAVAAAGVSKLVCASSAGAYSPGPRGRLVGEDWPVGGIETSAYSRHKALVEEQLDEFEARVPTTSVVRLRPALICKGEAASEIRRLFAGPIPQLQGLCFQAVHTSDVGRAYALAAIQRVSGAFNLTANPPLGSKDLAATLGLDRRLRPAPPGWLEMAMGVPLMSSERATRELGWEPRVTATEALAELLESGGGAGAHGPSRAGTGGGRDSREPERKLLEQLADAHAIAEQAAAQMRRAPAVAGDARLAAAFEEHLTETEEQERRVRARLEAHGADPANAGLAGKAGGIGVAVFAERLPDTPGELAAHSFSYAHMQIAAYELLRRTAEAAGDEETGAMAEQILEQERRMAKRLEGCFDAAVDASLNGGGEANLASQLDRCLGVAHAIERQGLQLLETGPKIVEDEELKRLFGEHLRQSEEHEAMVRERIEARSAAPSRAEDAPLRISGMQVGAFLAAQPDTVAKLTGLAFAFEQLEIAAYELLARLARRAGDGKVVGVVERILAEERAAARALAGRWDRGGA